MTLSQAHTQTRSPEDVSARWFTVAVITGCAFLAAAILSYVVG